MEGELLSQAQRGAAVDGNNWRLTASYIRSFRKPAEAVALSNLARAQLCGGHGENEQLAQSSGVTRRCGDDGIRVIRARGPQRHNIHSMVVLNAQFGQLRKERGFYNIRHPCLTFSCSHPSQSCRHSLLLHRIYNTSQSSYFFPSLRINTPSYRPPHLPHRRHYGARYQQPYAVVAVV